MEMAWLAQKHAHQARTSNKPLKFKALSVEEAAVVETIAEGILPADTTPGAKEAGVVWFIDLALSSFDRARRQAYREGVAAFEAKRRELFPSSLSMAALAPADVARLIGAMETTPFFEIVREHTITGFLANPEYGGNRGEAGWKLIGFSL